MLICIFIIIADEEYDEKGETQNGGGIGVEYNVLSYGAIGNGIETDTEAIQKAVDACFLAGGGRVILPGGHIYKSGSLVLKSNVEFCVESGAVLKASERLEDYCSFADCADETEKERDSRVPSYVNCEYAGRPARYFIYARGGANIRITGFGTIDGSEEIYFGKEGKYHTEGAFYPRIPLILLEEVEHLTVRDVTLSKCAFWTLHMAGCRDVLVDGIRMLNNLKMANCDGIDPDHCCDVRITNCHIECADDCIVLKNTRAYEAYGPCRNILISGCTLVSTSSAVKIGTESESDFENIVIENCSISRTNRGVSLQLRDKGNIRNVQISNMNIETRRFSQEWWGRAEPVYITVRDRKKGVTAGRIEHVCLSSVNCRGENGIFISGCRENSIRDVVMEHVGVVMEKSTKWPCASYDVRPCEGDGVIYSGLYGLYAELVDGLQISDCAVYCDQDMRAYMAGERRLNSVKCLRET